jgi:hypothetical protein
MLNDKQKKQFVIKLAQYEQDCGTLVQWKQRTDDEWNELVADLLQWKVEDGDQEALVAAYKAEGFPVTTKVLKDIHRACEATGLIQKQKKTPRRYIVERALNKDLKSGGKTVIVGKGRVDRALKVEKFLREERMANAIKVLENEMWKHFNVVGLVIKDNHDILTFENADAVWENYKTWWHSQYDAFIAEQKREQEASPNAQSAKG